MKIRIIFIIILVFIFCAGPEVIIGQSQSDSLLMQWAEFMEDESNLAEILEELAENPVNLNSNNRNELLRIPLINTSQIDSILTKKFRIGKLTNIFPIIDFLNFFQIRIMG